MRIHTKKNNKYINAVVLNLDSTEMFQGFDEGHLKHD